MLGGPLDFHGIEEKDSDREGGRMRERERALLRLGMRDGEARHGGGGRGDGRLLRGPGRALPETAERRQGRNKKAKRERVRK
jgi:hypothetical protein